METIFRLPGLEELGAIRQACRDFALAENDASYVNIWLLQEKYGCSVGYFEGILLRHYSGYKMHGKFSISFGEDTPEDKVRAAVEQLTLEAEARGLPLRLCFLNETVRRRLGQLYPGRWRFTEDGNHADYIHRRESLAEMRGKALHSKQNHVSHFYRLYPDAQTVPITAENTALAVGVARQWLEAKDESAREALMGEFRGIETALSHWDELELRGIMLTVDGKPIAMEVASELSPGMWDIHFEKVIPGYPQAWSAIVRESARYLTDADWINREEDLGEPGLRASKQSYKPERLNRKFNAEPITEGLYRLGIERESLRVDGTGHTVRTLHPAKLFPEELSANIGTDFAEAQLELRTHTCGSVEECYDDLCAITGTVLRSLAAEGEVLWPYSMPALITDNGITAVSTFGDSANWYEYKKMLYRKYGVERQLISGIHVNFSIPDEAYARLCQLSDAVPPLPDDGYVKIARVLLRNEALLMRLFGAAPFAFDQSDPTRYSDEDEYSIRNTKRGYRNLFDDKAHFDSLEGYFADLDAMVERGLICARYEYFGPVKLRLKNSDAPAGHTLDRIELRYPDLDPFAPCGISREDIGLYVLLMLGALLDAETGESLTDAARRANELFTLGMDEAVAELIRRSDVPGERAWAVREKLGTVERMTEQAKRHTAFFAEEEK